MDLTKSELKIKYDEQINLYFLSDIHFGQACVNKQALREAVATIAADKSARVLFLGDLIDAIVPLGDKRFNPLEIDREYSVADLEELPKKQADDFLALIDPIANKVIASVSGNHEDKFTKYHGFNPAKYIARRLGVGLIKYVGYHVIKVDVGSHVEHVTLFLNHGDGGGGKLAGAAKNKIDDLSRFFSADICAFAHVHRLETLHNTYIGLNKSYTGIVKRKTLSVCSGCFLTTYADKDNYFAHKGRRESDVGYIKATIKFSNDKDNGWTKSINATEVRL